MRFDLGEQPVVRYHARKSPLPRPDIDPLYQRGGPVHGGLRARHRYVVGEN